ncbi:hypothetical protein ASPCADRAFT_517912 [Aspergillus carbonarius ITEM 5010]|uniref:Uncharacterized protein n=1 Tax=Aspergillus carbonarius (strain ITEM 5010) TaxID=602072 RepID=A0A1R3RDH3_ASPC5|nr:hypothetical protein ASPCADRAFT_517912 [Aspergillus carbonarius ITEM 5010]
MSRSLLILVFVSSNVHAFNTIHTNCTLPPPGTKFVTAPNTRGSLQILWSSLFTILACTWTVLHLNVPKYVPEPDKKQFWKWLKWAVHKYQHPVKWFLLTVVAPEVSFTKYWDDQSRGRSLFYHYEHELKDKGWTKTHLLFANMGVTPAGNETSPHDTASECNRSSEDPANKFKDAFHLTATDVLKILLAEEENDKLSVPELRNVSVEEINDRSKTDIFMRLLAVGQIVWVVVQILSRWIYGLNVSQLEVTVVAFAFCAVGMYISNRGKPQGVNVPILFKYPATKATLEKSLESTNLPKPRKEHKLWPLFKCRYCENENTSNDSNKNNLKKNTTNNESNTSDSNDSSSQPTHLHFDTGNTSRHEDKESVDDDEQLPSGFTSMVGLVRTFLHSPHYPGGPVGNGFIDNVGDDFTDMSMFLGSMLFGGIHLAAWDFQFPTTVEKYLWWAAALWCTVCVLVCTVIYFLLIGLAYVYDASPQSLRTNLSPREDAQPTDPPLEAPINPISVSATPKSEPNSVRDVESQGSPPRCRTSFGSAIILVCRLFFNSFFILFFFLLMILIYTCMIAYVLARLFIMVEMFRTLAFLPTGAYVATWASDIPNLG